MTNQHAGGRMESFAGYWRYFRKESVGLVWEIFHEVAPCTTGLRVNEDEVARTFPLNYRLNDRGMGYDNFTTKKQLY